MVGPAHLDDVPTPALTVERARVLTNLEEMAARAGSLGVALRPHAKTHKSPVIATLQREYGATGLTVATVAEAECFAAHGHDDLLITTPPVGDWRLERLVSLARRARVRVALDDVEVVDALDRACRRGGRRDRLPVGGRLWSGSLRYAAGPTHRRAGRSCRARRQALLV